MSSDANIDEISNEDKLKHAHQEMILGVAAVRHSVDKLTSSKLKRVLKAVAHVHIAEEIISGNQLELSEEEKNVVDKIFALQESVLGYTVFNEEFKNVQEQDANQGFTGPIKTKENDNE